MSSIITLSSQTPFARGGHRDCYIHPSDDTRCIKVLHQPWKEIERRLNDPLRHFRRRKNYDENLGEWIELRKLERKLGARVSNHFPRGYGIVETDLGEGLVVDYIQDHDGQPSLTLKSYLWEHGLTDACQTAIEAFWAFLENYRVTVRDPFPHNLVVQHGANGQTTLYQIDGFGSSDFLPFSRLIPAFTIRKLQGRRRRMERQISKHLQEIERGAAPVGKGVVHRNP